MNVREVQAGANGQAREPGIMLDAADSFFRHGEQKIAVASDARGRIVHLRIVESERDH